MLYGFQGETKGITGFIFKLRRPISETVRQSMLETLKEREQALMSSLEQRYDEEVEDEWMQVQMWRKFFDECGEVITSRRPLKDSKVAENWMNNSFAVSQWLTR